MAALTADNINPGFKRIKYEIRGPLVVRAEEIEQELARGVKKPFTEIILHVGDPHRLGQQPITYFRQVLALMLYPQMMESDLFPQDVKARAHRLLAGCGGGSVGSYPNGTGLRVVREDIAKFLERRDSHPADPRHIFMGNGATDGIEIALSACNTEESGRGRPGILVPCPGYPMYTGKLLEINAHIIPYELDEDDNWALSMPDVGRALDDARPFCTPRALILINPGNPTGQVLTYENIADVIKLCKKERLVLIADEVYQENIYQDGVEFHSCKKVLRDLGVEYDDVQLISIHCAAKGYYGECGLRGGFFELVGFSDEVLSYIRMRSMITPVPPLTGQALMSLVCNPPQPGDQSYESFTKEKNAVMDSLRKKAMATVKTLNSLEGIQCHEIAGSIYAFPRLLLPDKAIEEAKRRGQHPDMFYARELLENTGIFVVPGSGFGEKEGTFHVRFTILPSDEITDPMLERLRKFHQDFMNQYR